MSITKELLSKLRDPFKVCAILSFSLGFVSVFPIGPWQKIFGGLFLVSLILLLIILIALSIDWYLSRPRMRVFRNWEEAPNKYRVEETLDYCAKQGASLEIIARTCFRWLCGDENLFGKDQEAFIKDQKRLQDLIIRAIEGGASIHFILQNANISIPYFTQVETDRLHTHVKAALQSYETIHDRLNIEHQELLRLSFTNDVIENSMVRLTEGSRIARIIFDLGIKFKSPHPTVGKISKPFIVIESFGSEIGDFNDEFNYTVGKATLQDDYNEQKGIHLSEAIHLIENYRHHSPLRKDTSASLAAFAARHYLAEIHSDINHKIPEPACVQLLVTNRCTTKCKMCDHFKLFRKGNELADSEINCVLDMIHHMGTRFVVISGGEPLAHDSLAEILKHAKRLGLNVGLLTNGVKPDGEHIEKSLADVIADSCSWVQLSIDSFNTETYEQIRGGRHLNSARSSLDSLLKAGLSKIEVCVTIQKDNISEVTRMLEKSSEILPSSVPIRFKFAHGPINGRDFLFSREQLDSLIKSIPPGDLNRSNWGYLLTMINDKHFDIANLPLGKPLESKMEEFATRDYVCHALRLTCKINADGNVYPCCFLFDDNFSNSRIRNDYFLGSLRSKNTGRVLSPYSHHADNLLQRIWCQNDKLNGLRNFTLPVDRKACIYCTRHFYQNDFLNKLWRLFDEGKLFGLAQELSASVSMNQEPEGFWV